MPGYRDTSSYSPYGEPAMGRPLRPFNWVQWTGVALAAIGLDVQFLYFAGQFGWVPAWIRNPGIGTPGLFLGVVLVTSRRQPDIDLAPELAPARKRWMTIVTILCVVTFGVAIILTLLGV